MNRRSAVLASITAALALAAGTAVTAPAAQAAGTKTITGTIVGSDRRAVSALLGFDLKDSQGRALNADGSIKTTPGYGVTKRINFDLNEYGSSDTTKWATTWSVTVPANTARTYIEAYPSGARYTGTNEARYGHSYRRNIAVPYGQRVNIRLPLICGAGGTTGYINGYSTVAGKRVPLKRVTTWSQAPDNNLPTPILGWNVGTSASTGYFKLPNLPADQVYQVLATAPDGRVKRIYNVKVNPCKGTYLGVAF